MTDKIKPADTEAVKASVPTVDPGIVAAAEAQPEPEGERVQEDQKTEYAEWVKKIHEDAAADKTVPELA